MTQRPNRSSSNLGASLTPIQVDFCRKIIDKIWNLPISIFFHREVDPIQDQCPDYYDKIKRPMDLKKVKEKLESGQYPNVERFKDDMNQIWKNAMVYNAPDNPVHIIAHELKSVFGKESEFIPKNEIEAWIKKVVKRHKKLSDLTNHKVTSIQKAAPDSTKRPFKLKLTRNPQK